MELIAVGGDKRYAHLVRLARLHGMKAAALGLERAELADVPNASLDDLASAECVVMPNPFQKGLVAPFAQAPLALPDVLARLSAGTTLALFGSSAVPDDITARHPVILLHKDERLTLALARQTAEGAIHACQERMDTELYGARALIIGYGRIAKALHLMLHGYGAHVTVAARRAEARSDARHAGAEAVDLTEMEQILPAQQLIFSTPPERVLDARRIDLISRRALLVDLSSPPYGVDLSAAVARWLNAWREPALPGRYCPLSAGSAMLDALCLALKGAETHG